MAQSARLRWLADMRPSAPIFDELNGPGGNAELLANHAADNAIRQQTTDCRNVALNQLVPTDALAGHVGARNVFPVVAADNLVDGFQPDAVKQRNVFAVFSVGNALKDFRDLALGKLGRTGGASRVFLVQSRVVSVLNVFGVRNPLKVAQAIVSLIAVYVVAVMAFGRGADESRKCKPVDNQRCLLPTCGDKGDGRIASRVKLWLQNAVCAASLTSGKPFDAPKVADRVYAFPFGNVFPVFHHAKTIPQHGTNCQ